MTVIRAVIWDLDNTLFDRDAAFARWFGALPIAPSSAQQAECARLDDRGQGSRRALFGWMAAQWPVLGGPEQIWGSMRAALPGLARPAEGMRAAVKRWPCCVLTNGSGPLQRAKAEAIGVPLAPERILVSGELGYAKPDPRAFAAAGALVGGEATVIGDDPRADIEGARRAGLRTVWMRRGRSWPVGRPPPDRVIDSLEELL